ncbi:MAG: hypothetical protein K2X44_02825, partial [Magnetospirillum sp.]|nr:hypothetical protein [Magnetospirillum sp.]
QMRGASLEAAEEITVGSPEGFSSITDVQMVRMDEHTHYEDGGWFGKHKTTTETRTTVTSRPSTITSSNNTVTLLSGKDKETTILGSHVTANKPIIFKGGKSNIRASVGYNTTSTQTTVERLFSSSSSIARQSIPVVFSSSLKTPMIQFLTEGNPVVITGCDIITLVFDASLAGQVTCSPTVGRMSYFQQVTGRSLLARHDIGCSGYEDVARPTRIQANKIILNMDPALKHIMTSVDWHPEAIEIIGHYAEKTVHLDRQHHQWAHHHQTIPAPVVQVLAMAAAYFTGGLGGFIGNVIAGAGTLGSVVIQAGVQALCAQFVGSFASHGDPLQAWKDVSSPKSLESIGVAMASAGALQSIAPTLKVNMAPGQTDVLANLQKFGLKNMV